MIQDAEMRELFRIESEEHLSRLDDGLLRLEKTPHDQSILDEVFREAHSLKGAARMLDLTDIETISHSIENILGTATKGKTSLSSDAIDRLYKGLDAIRMLAEEALTGKPANVAVSDVLYQLQSLSGKQPPTSVGKQPRAIDDRRVDDRQVDVKIDAAPLEKAESSADSIISPPLEKSGGEGLEKIGGFHIETIRVETGKLDALMTHTGELTVSKIRLANRIAEIEEVTVLWEEINKTRNSTLIKGEERYALRDSHSAFDRLGGALDRLRSSLHEDGARLDFIAGELEDGVRSIRLLPLATVFNLFPRTVRNLAREQSKEAELLIEGGDTTADKRIIEEMKDPLMHLIRNAVDHGIETPQERESKGKPRKATIALKAYRTATNVVIEVSDDGLGLDAGAIRRAVLKKRLYREEELTAMPASQIYPLIFLSGLSTSSFVSDVSGRGIGLDVVRTNVERLKGTIHVESSSGAGCTFTIQLPITLATMRVLIISVNGTNYAIAAEYVRTTRRVQRSEIFTIEGHDTIMFDNLPVSVARLSGLLEIRTPQPVPSASPAEAFPCIILSAGGGMLGLIVDDLLDEQEIVLKPQGVMLKRIRNVSGATILGTGEVCMVLNPHDLIKSARKREVPADQAQPVEQERKKYILMAEDSITTRTQIKRILEGAGYEVVAAVDGLDALGKLGSRDFDALVSDILMPNMDGLTLTAKVRQDKKYKEMPVILITSLASDEDRKRGIEAGANAYITKSGFDQKALLDTLRRLI